MPLSIPAVRAAFAETSDEAWLTLLTIDHPDLAAPIRVVNNHANVTSRGNLFVGYPFEIDLPSDIQGELPRVRLAIDNVDRQIVDSLRAIATPFTASVEVVLASDPDTVEGGPFQLSAASAEYDALGVEAELAFEDVLNEPYPGDSFTPARYPGLF